MEALRQRLPGIEPGRVFDVHGKCHCFAVATPMARRGGSGLHPADAGLGQAESFLLTSASPRQNSVTGAHSGHGDRRHSAARLVHTFCSDRGCCRAPPRRTSACSSSTKLFERAAGHAASHRCVEIDTDLPVCPPGTSGSDGRGISDHQVWQRRRVRALRSSLWGILICLHNWCPDTTSSVPGRLSANTDHSCSLIVPLPSRGGRKAPD